MSVKLQEENDYAAIRNPKSAIHALHTAAALLNTITLNY